MIKVPNWDSVNSGALLSTEAGWVIWAKSFFLSPVYLTVGLLGALCISFSCTKNKGRLQVKLNLH